MTFYNVFFPGLVLEKVKQNDETQSGNEKKKKNLDVVKLVTVSVWLIFEYGNF